jgi:predicted Zn-ribbon and HTH transcriptional regulator
MSLHQEVERVSIMTTVEPQDHAVCDACGWEGDEDMVVEKSVDYTTPDRCPRCRQFYVNYFIKPAS